MESVLSGEIYIMHNQTKPHLMPKLTVKREYILKTPDLQFILNRNKMLKNIRFEWAWCLAHFGYPSYLLYQIINKCQ